MTQRDSFKTLFAARDDRLKRGVTADHEIKQFSKNFSHDGI